MTKEINPTEMPSIVPYLMVQDVSKALNFYETAFHFERTTEESPGPDNTIWHAAMRYREQVLMIGKSGGYDQTATPNMTNTACPIGLYVQVDNVDEFFKHATAQGAETVSEPEDMFWGDRCCQLKDPDGYIWSFASRQK